MDWTTEPTSKEQQLHSASCAETSEEAIKNALFECADRAFSLLSESIGDNAMYCLFTWSAADSSLTIAVTDETKTHDGKHIVTVQFSGIEPGSAENEEGEDDADKVKYWLTDYLTTCPAFLAYSLLAGFVRSSRDRVELM